MRSPISLREFASNASPPFRLALLSSSALATPPAAQGSSDPSDPGILEPVLTELNGEETRVPQTDQASGGQLLNLVGLVIGQHTEGYGVAKMCSHADHSLGGFCQDDLFLFNSNGVRNVDTDGDGLADVLWFPPLLRNPDANAGGDIIPPTAAWKPFLWLNPANGMLFMDENYRSQGLWADQTYPHGRPLEPDESATVKIEAPRASGQVFYQFYDLFHDSAIFSPQPTFEVDKAPAVSSGFGTPGSNGEVPRFSGTGKLDLGNDATFVLSNAAPNALAVLVYSETNDSLPVCSGTLVPGFLWTLQGFTTDDQGELSFSVNGDGGPLDVYAQFGVVEPGFDVVLSNALQVLLRP